MKRATYPLADAGSQQAQFQSTPSMKRATWQRDDPGTDVAVSIHALNEEGDLTSQLMHGIMTHVSIHALNEEGDAAGRFA